VKSKTLAGFDAPYVPGWDCPGLPIELQVEKAHGKTQAPAKFRELCRDYAKEQIERQKADFIRLGVLGEWDNPYLTMDYKFEADIMRTLGRIHANGYLFQGQKPVHWCVDCGSALAEAEVEYEDKASPAIDVAFAVKDVAALVQALSTNPSPQPSPTGGEGANVKGAGFDRGANVKGAGFDRAGFDLPVYAVIWTTTPWTLPANQAVCVHPDFIYDLIQTPKGILILAHDLAEACITRYGFDAVEVVATVQGSALEHLQLQHPFYDRSVPVICGDHVTLEAGTGLVHTAPAHGLEDYAVGGKYNLPVECPVGGDGKFYPGIPLVGGQSIWAANKIVVETLANSGALLLEIKLKHSYPHCWRHKTPIIFRATHQWFIGMEATGQHSSLRKAALKAVENTEFFPSWGRARLEAMIKNRPDWCVSRQRNWGVPMPLFVHKESGELHPRTAELLEQVAQRVEGQGIEAWFSLEAAELLGAEAETYKKVSDTLDVWFDSGSTHACVLKRRDYLQHPADLYLEGSDQHRGWFQSSLLTGCGVDGHAPYKALLTHGFVVDGNGHKMSKSKGNVIAPQKVVDSLGADILRLWVASTDYSGELTISDEILKRVTESYRRIRNTLRFLLSNIADFDPARHALPVEEWLEIDRYALAMARDFENECKAYYEKYEFHFIVQKLQAFCSEDLGGFYLDILKDRLYTAGADSRARRSAQNALYHITHSLVRLMAPILSFTAEEAWQALAKNPEDSIFLHTWNDVLLTQPEEDVIRQRWAQLRRVRADALKQLEEVRVSGQIGSSLAAEVDLYAIGEIFDLLDSFGDDLRFVFITSQARLHQGSHPEALAGETGVGIRVSASPQQKCERCWHYRADVGADAATPGLCGRCVSNLHGAGEPRQYA
ncbi:MAG: isoleucine--tRNA ligase, partial [Sulfuricella sp.]|nr:isoleucine--tRNA ligase [Sulfuricella sp.]